VRVRIGLHTGRPTRTPSGYQGISVNAASRLCACGHGGQILMSRAVQAAMADAPAYELRHLGTHRLRGIPDEHDIYQLVAPDLVDGFPSLRLDAAVGAGYRIPH
jgi:adenylate cyclase